MNTHPTNLKLRSGKFSIEQQQYENIGLNERMVSMFLSGVLISRGIKRPLKAPFLYGAYLAYRALTGRCLLYERLGIDASKPHAINVRGEFEIDRPAAEVYAYWRNLNNLTARIKHLMNVEIVEEDLSNWKSKVMGKLFAVDWKVEVVKDEPGRLIGWRSAAGTWIGHVGKVEFADIPGQQGTLLKIVFSYHPPAGGIGLALAKLLNPYFESLLRKEIKTFKHTIETTISETITPETIMPHQF